MYYSKVNKEHWCSEVGGQKGGNNILHEQLNKTKYSTLNYVSF